MKVKLFWKKNPVRFGPLVKSGLAVEIRRIFRVDDLHSSISLKRRSTIGSREHQTSRYRTSSNRRLAAVGGRCCGRSRFGMRKAIPNRHLIEVRRIWGSLRSAHLTFPATRLRR